MAASLFSGAPAMTEPDELRRQIEKLRAELDALIVMIPSPVLRTLTRGVAQRVVFILLESVRLSEKRNA